jgi:hypothetical protein
MPIGDYVVAVLLLAIVGVLIAGVVLMGIGGKANAKYGNKLMVARVSLQGFVILLLAILFMTGKK